MCAFGTESQKNSQMRNSQPFWYWTATYFFKIRFFSYATIGPLNLNFEHISYFNLFNRANVKIITQIEWHCVENKAQTGSSEVIDASETERKYRNISSYI